MTLSTEPALDSRIAPAAELARLAGDIALRHYRSNLTIEIKADGSPVTVADRAAETAAREWVRRYFPSDGMLGEEFGEERPEAPADGSSIPSTAPSRSCAARRSGGRSSRCAKESACLPAQRIFPPSVSLIAAAPGAGCWWNGLVAVCRRSSMRSRRATVLTSDDRFRERPGCRAGWERVADAAAVSRTWGDCFGYLLVATGRAEAMLDPVMSPWDAAALQPIIEEAGGVFTDWTGRATAFGGSAVATNQALAEPVRSLLHDSISP